MNAAEHRDTITVGVDSEVQPIVPRFLENRKNDCLMICSLLESGAFSEIGTLGHRMKGAGGFDDISEIGEVIEEAALATGKETISSAILRLSDYLEPVTVEYV